MLMGERLLKARMRDVMPVSDPRSLLAAALIPPVDL